MLAKLLPLPFKFSLAVFTIPLSGRLDLVQQADDDLADSIFEPFSLAVPPLGHVPSRPFAVKQLQLQLIDRRVLPLSESSK